MDSAILAACLSALAAVPQDTTLVLRGGHYLDTRAGVLRPNGAIVVRDGRIAELRPPAERLPLPPDARTLDLSGRTILPGLVDAHVHLTLGGDPEANAEATLRAGFTTVVDLGSAAGAGLKLRDEFAQGTRPGPTVIAAGSWIGAKGGVCEFGGATVSGPEEARRRARADLEAGADLLKVCVTGWPADAVAAKRSIYAHAIGQAGALLAAEHGVRALAHTPIVDSAAARRLKAAGVVVISTLATLTARPEADEIRRSFRLLHSSGVPVVLGTDAGVLPHGRNANELQALVQAGLTPAEGGPAGPHGGAAPRARPALGVIAVGAAADFLVVAGDPLKDPALLTRPTLVLKAGRQP